MNSLKKIAAVSGILFALALLVAIITAPFAVSGGIDFYNGILEQAEQQKEEHWFDTTMDSAVKELTLADSGYYGIISVEQSPDNQIHILNQDKGFSYIVPDVNIRGVKAELNFLWINDPKLTEENIIQWLAAELYDDYSRQSIIQLPADVSLHFAEENMGDLYHHVRLDYKGFANYEELQSQLDGWSAVLEARSVYDEHQNIVLSVLNDISRQRESIAWAAEDCTDVEKFQEEWAVEYINIKEQRSDMLKRSYNFRKEYGEQSAEELEAAYLEMNSVIVELCEYEKEYDLLTAKVAEANNNLNDGNRTANAQKLEQLAQTAFDRQVELDLSISKLREKLNGYLLEELVDMDAGRQQPGFATPSEVPPTDVPAEAPVPVQP